LTELAANGSSQARLGAVQGGWLWVKLPGEFFKLIYTLNPLQDPRWAEFLMRTPRASAFHSIGWLRALVQTYNYSPVVFTTTPPDHPLDNGTVFAVVKSWLIRPRLVSLPFSDHVDPLMSLENGRVELLTELSAEQRAGRWKKIELRPPAVESQLHSLPFCDGESFVLQSVNLGPDLDAIFSRFHRDSIRRKIRKAERSNVSQEVGRSDRLLQQFFTLHIMTRRRQSLPPPPISWFRNILACLGESAKIRVASKDGTPIAAIFTLRFKETAVYKYGCTNRVFHNLGAMPFLLWKAIEDEHRSGAKVFDLGRSDLWNSGLIRFKQKLGAELTALTYKVFPADRYAGAAKDWRLTWAKKLFRLLPEKAFVAAGARIYPHIG
jgi:hypothetical protein